MGFLPSFHLTTLLIPYARKDTYTYFLCTLVKLLEALPSLAEIDMNTLKTRIDKILAFP